MILIKILKNRPTRRGGHELPIGFSRAESFPSCLYLPSDQKWRQRKELVLHLFLPFWAFPFCTKGGRIEMQQKELVWI